MSSPLEGEISSFAFGGKGILRTQEGMVVFVPFTAPGEKITYTIAKKKKHYAEGQLLKVLQPSKHRIKPLCPYFLKCGGCQLQHLDYPYQMLLKQQTVQEALSRVYPHVEVAASPSKQQWNYRRRVHLTLKASKQGFEAGYIGEDNQSLVTVQECPIFLPSQHPLIPLIAAMAKKLHADPENSGKVALIKLHEEKFLAHFHFKRLPKNSEEIAKEFLQAPLAGILFSAPGKEIRCGEESLLFTIDNFSFKYTPRAFIQNHPDESLLIYQTIQQEIKAFKPRVLLDLYSGIGVASILAAPHTHSIEAIEANKEAVSLAKQNAVINSCKNIRFHQGLVEEKISQALTKKPDMAISNPPREGMERTACEKLAGSSIQRLLYISCHPATLARDLHLFKEKGFDLSQAQAFDMFPQTGHIETLVILNRIK